MCTKEFNMSCFVYLDSNQGFSVFSHVTTIQRFLLFYHKKKKKRNKNKTKINEKKPPKAMENNDDNGVLSINFREFMRLI